MSQYLLFLLFLDLGTHPTNLSPCLTQKTNEIKVQQLYILWQYLIALHPFYSHLYFFIGLILINLFTSQLRQIIFPLSNSIASLVLSPQSLHLKYTFTFITFYWSRHYYQGCLSHQWFHQTFHTHSAHVNVRHKGCCLLGLWPFVLILLFSYLFVLSRGLHDVDLIGLYSTARIVQPSLVLPAHLSRCPLPLHWAHTHPRLLCIQTSSRSHYAP